mmetsp:Transcript_13595/g.54993  ORF Transcript_13595/g.54993 Transcript_13595/m.54993 type:complete len:283 (-) Transcript_13595:2036-2884(-)
MLGLHFLPLLLLLPQVHQQAHDSRANLAHARGNLGGEGLRRGLDQRHQPEDANLLVVLPPVVLALVSTFSGSIAQHAEPGLQRGSQGAVLDQYIQGQRRVVPEAVGHDLDEKVLQVGQLARLEPLQRDRQIRSHAIVHPTLAVLEDALEQLWRGEHLRLGDVVVQEHAGRDSEDVAFAGGVRQERLGAARDVVVHRNQDVLEVLHAVLAVERADEHGPQLPHRRGHGGGVVRHVRQNLQNLLVHVVSVGAEHLPHDGHQRRLELRVHVGQRGEGFEDGGYRA